ncbi:MAG: oxygen-dependent coproporphyrinogen oxidase [Flavobacteriales bacterium]
MTHRERIAKAFRAIQENICAQLGTLDGKARFTDDVWQRAEGGGGSSRPIAHGDLIEKGGVNFSEVFGPLSTQASKALKVEGDAFYATGVSIVLHAHNPWVPTIHMNIRYFEVGSGDGQPTPDSRQESWFGGGIDLTPAYVDEAIARHFHQRLRAECNKWHPSFYADHKRWADDYFFLPHRNETRGVGGIFFDRLSPDGATGSPADAFGYVQGLGNLFAPLYAEVANRARVKPFAQRERDWQLLRRGRYVEFNLVHDRGTRFGLETGGRTESILMSLPADARWQYDHRPEPGSDEEATLRWLRKGVDWAG